MDLPRVRLLILNPLEALAPFASIALSIAAVLFLASGGRL